MIVSLCSDPLRSRSHSSSAGLPFVFVMLLSLSNSSAFGADSSEASQSWSVHGQVTHLWQYHPGFRSPYRGVNSLDPGSRGDETFDATVYAGARLWTGLEIWINPEIDQGFGLSNTFGVAGFPSGEAYKFGRSEPYFRLQRLFFRQTISLGGEAEYVEPDVNQLGGMRTGSNLVVTAGQISVTDIFDTNAYAHAPQQDFLNWAVIDSGAFDYAADAWAYSYGIATEWTQAWWTLRAGLFDLSRVPNNTELETDFSQFELVGEAEGRHMFFGRPGKALNLEQDISADLGVFARASINDGSKEAYEFTEINRSLSAGLSLKGSPWRRPQDVFGLAAVTNGLSTAARTYFAAGGLGILIGDGRLARYGSENIIETYYNVNIAEGFALAADYQLITHPAYNRDRGPVSVLGMRVHVQY